MTIFERLERTFKGSYSLVDSGGFEKLERLEGKLIRRPSSLCLWKQSKSRTVWEGADARFDPKKGWSFKNKPFSDWVLNCSSFKLKLRLQTNGQIGLFPEHASYLKHIDNYSSDLSGKKVLNLFAYSGMASMYCLSKGAEVCHVDSSKKALDWAKENTRLNGFEESKLRLIADDALSFLKREGRREKRYDIVILDPPSFSRLEGKKTWKLEDVLYEFVESSVSLLSKNALLIFSCHHQALDSRVLKNVFSESGLSVLESADLSVREKDSSRELPAGVNITLRNAKS